MCKLRSLDIDENVSTDKRFPLQGSATIQIRVNGIPVQAFSGETIAAALLRTGIRNFRHTRKMHAPRGIYCGMGVCFECLVSVNGEPNIQACQTLVSEGMQIETGD